MQRDQPQPPTVFDDATDPSGAVHTQQQVVLSVVMPAYNEEGAIREAVDDVRQFVFSRIPEAELIVVNDGSRDHTAQRLDEMQASEPRLRVIHQPNAGHGPAVRRGLDAARGEYVLLIDSDRQIPLSQFATLWDTARGRDAVMGVRRERVDRPTRRAISRVLPLMIFTLFGVWLRDSNVPFRIVRRRAWLDARRVIPADAVTPSLLFSVFLRKGPYDVVECVVPHLERASGQESVHHGRLMRFCATALRQLIAFRFRL